MAPNEQEVVQKITSAESQKEFLRQIEAVLHLLMEKLKEPKIDRFQASRLSGILEIYIKFLVQASNKGNKLTLTDYKLTPVELQVAIMVKEGLATQDIAKNLNISPGTVKVHRKHIRKKLGLTSKANNLKMYLMAWVE